MNEVIALEQSIRANLSTLTANKLALGADYPCDMIADGQAILAGKPTPRLSGTRLDRLRRIAGALVKATEGVS